MHKHPLTSFGIDVHVFCTQNGLNLTELAKRVGVSYATLSNVSRGHRPGHDIIPRVYAYMKSDLAERRCN